MESKREGGSCVWGISCVENVNWGGGREESGNGFEVRYEGWLAREAECGYWGCAGMRRKGEDEQDGVDHFQEPDCCGWRLGAGEC